MRHTDDFAAAASTFGTIAEAADVRVGVHLGRAKDHPVVRALGTASEAGDQPPLLAA